MWPGFSRFAANAGKTAHIRMRPRECGEVTTLPGEAERAVQQASRVIDFSERPQDHRQPAHGNDPVIEDEPGAKMVIPLVVIGREGPFKVRVRADVIALEPASHARDMQRPPPRWQSGGVPNV